MPTLRFNEYNEEWMPCLLSNASYYLKDRKQAIKSIFVSTENMRQNCSGIEQYIDGSVVEGIVFDKNDILIANIRPYLKKAWKATFNGVCSTDVLALHIKKALPDFIYRIIENDDFFAYVMSAAKGSKMPRGDKQHIMNYQIALPCIQEQKKISDFFQYLDLRIIKQRQLINSLISYKRGLSTAIFDKKSLIINSTVKTVSLGSFCDITMGQSPDSISYNTEGIGLPLVQGNADMRNGITTPTKYTSSPTKTCDAGNIILSVRAPVGSVGISNQKICIGRGVCGISSANNDYVLQYLKHCEKQWRTLEQGGTFTAISGDDIKSFPFILPNDKEIVSIVKLLKGLDSLISCQETLLGKLIYCKQSMLQSLFI